MRRHHAHARDNSLRRLTLANRWLIAGSVALTGVLTEVAAQAFPGKAKPAATSAGAHKGTSNHKSSSTHTTTTQKSITPPAEAPQGASEPSSEASEPRPEATSEPTPEATHESTPETSAPATSEPSPSVESSGSSSGSSEASAPVEESSAPVVSGGS